MELIKNLSWRYATKKFDASKKVKEENIELLKEAIRLSASSYGFRSNDDANQHLKKVRKSNVSLFKRIE